MNLHLDIRIADNYKSNSQKARVFTEFWVKNNGFCPNCGTYLSEFENNRPVADFLCKNCREEFELKSKNAFSIGNKIVDGAYATMIERIESKNNPNFFFLTYDKNKLLVSNYLIIPNYYFISDIIEAREPLSENARRFGWIGCNINLLKIPDTGRIFFVKESKIIDQKIVKENWRKTKFLKNKSGESKGWVIDIMNCLDNIKKTTFELKDVYMFENKLKQKYPNNNFIKDKIRQQLQILRDKGIIEFLGRGHYKKV